ncbi:MAG: GerMN domain-containing protein [Limnochordales bacterium]|nr:GerMN domain-containing protein [Limnochordales bacterium]
MVPSIQWLGRVSRHGLVVALLAAIAWTGWRWEGQRVLPLHSPAISRPVVTVTLYFPARSGDLLLPEVRQIDAERSSPGDIVRELLKGPSPGLPLVNPFPPGTRLLDWDLEPDGTLVVDFSREIVTRHWGGTAGELATVYSLVNTLTSRSGVRAVLIKVEGQPVDTLAGHLDLRYPLTFAAELVAGG